MKIVYNVAYKNIAVGDKYDDPLWNNISFILM